MLIATAFWRGAVFCVELAGRLLVNDWPRAVATAAIWVSTGMALGFGLFKMNFNGGVMFVFMLPVVLTGMVVLGATLATRSVWRNAAISPSPVPVAKRDFES